MFRPSLLLIGCLLAGMLGAITPDRADKEATARQVFERLVAARGEVGIPPPAFIFSTGKRSGARCVDNTVVLEEAAFDVCSTLPEPEAALAGILAHELVHYYEGHARERATGLVGADGAREQEARADLLGGFLAYLAGYPTADVMPGILDGLYAAYDLPDTLAGYPPLDRRKQSAAESYARMQRLVAVFEMANTLTALDRYAEAATYYTTLLEAFPSREMHNNLGVVYGRAALGHFQPATLRFIYPLELDLRSRLAGSTRGPRTDPATRNFYLGEARAHFERARLLDPDYAPALVNLATTHALLRASLLEGEPGDSLRELAEDRYLEARLRAREAIRLAEATDHPLSAANARQLLGILAAERGDSAQAEAYFEGGADSPLAMANLCLLRTGALPTVEPRARETFTLTEKIGGLSIAEFPAPDSEPSDIVAVTAGSDRMLLTTYAGPESGTTVLHHRYGDDRGPALLTVGTGPAYSGTTAMEIRTGSRSEDVLREYGPPDYRITTVGGELMVYSDTGIIFSLRAGGVSGWTLFEDRP